MPLSPYHERKSQPIPAHPYRDSAVMYGVLAVVVVVVGSLTGGDLARTILLAVVFFVAATGWAWWRFRARIRERDAAAVSDAE